MHLLIAANFHFSEDNFIEEKCRSLQEIVYLRHFYEQVDQRETVLIKSII